MKSKKLAALMSAAVLTVTAMPFSSVGNVSAAGSYNYAEALQKSMFFYEVQQSGKLPDWNNVQWRADSMVDESGKETDAVPGGWFDAGDHFKFTLTNAYSASIMAWGYLEYKDAIEKAGLEELYRKNIVWGLDYVLGCDQGGGSMIGTIGDFKGGATDHNIWCSPEVYLRRHHKDTGNWTRPNDVIKNASVAGLSAAALAEGYLMLKDTEPDKAANYLKHAKDLFAGADKIRDTKDRGGMGDMYPTSTWIEDCMYAALWLYKATGDQSYLDKVEKDYIPQFPTESQSTDWKYTWGLCWDDTTQAAALLYAQITGKDEWINHIDKHIRYWMGGSSDLKPFQGKITADGLSHLTDWGCLRHATNTAWIAKLACDTIFKDDSAKVSKYNAWADSQMNYCFGVYFFDYGNAFLLESSRAGADILKEDGTFRYPSYVQDIMGPMYFDYGFGPFRWVCMSEDPDDLATTDRLAMDVLRSESESAPDEIKGQMQDNIKWIDEAGKNHLVVGSQARILYADCEGRTRIALAFNDAIRDGRLKAPVVLGRDHHDVSGTDSPFRETSNIYDGSRFTADMAVQNVIGDAFRGATWVSIHNGGGVGWGEVINGGFGMVIDGSEDSARHIRQMLFWDVNNGIARRSWARNEGSIHAIRREMERTPGLQVTMPHMADDDIIKDALK